QSFAKSARETSESLLPAATTTAMFLIPANAPAAKSARHHKIAAIGNPLGNRSNFIGLSRFAQVSRQYVQSRRLLASIPFEACVQPYASPQRSRAANPLLILPHHLPYRSVSASSWSALGSGTRTYPEFNSGQECFDMARFVARWFLPIFAGSLAASSL